ncbi:hypothetical protein ES706_05509 [subsurface metagenome]
MATLLNKQQITNLKDLTGIVEDLSGEHDVLWFRGCGRSSYLLKPSLYRHPSITQIRELLNLEQKITERFKQRCLPYLSQPITLFSENPYWEWLFRMRHAGVPTRLLDWTENPYIALFFALTAASYKISDGHVEYEENVAVWILDPCAWNEKVLESIGWKGGILYRSDSGLNGYVWKEDVKVMRKEPANIYGTQNSTSMVVQSGVFTIFGSDLRPMEETYIDENFPQDCIIKLEFPKDKIGNLISSMLKIGYTDLIVSPSLEGLANEIKRIYGYPV